MIKLLKKKILFVMQFLIFIVANFFYSRNNISEKKIVIATTEVAKMLYMLNKQ